MIRESALANAPRMSISALNQTDDPDRQVRIWLLGSVEVKGTVFYKVAGRFMSSGQTWQVNRRYSEFLMLRDTLVKFFSRSPDTCPGCLNYLHAIKQFDFPKKHVFVSRSQIVVNYRVKALRSFINLLASWAFSNSPKCPTCGGFAFDIVRNFVLEGAEAQGDSNMSYIRDSFVVSTFTDPQRRPSLTRRNSFIPSSGSQTLQTQRHSELQHRNTMGSGPEQRRQGRDEGDAYERFNDYLIRQPSSQAKALQSRSMINIPHNSENESRPEYTRASSSSSRNGTSSSTNSGRGAAKPQQSTASARTNSQNGSFLFYQDGVERGNSTSAASSQRTPASTGAKHGILKNWNEVRNERAKNESLGGSSTSVDADDYALPRSNRSAQKNRNDTRSDNDSYFSLGASSAHSGDRDEYAAPSSKRNGAAGNRGEEELPTDMRYDRSQNDSYLSLGASSTGDLEEEFHSHHPSVMPSPTSHDDIFAQPPPPQKYVGQPSKKDMRSPPPSSQRKSERVRSPPPSSRSNRRDDSPPIQRAHSPPPSRQTEQPRSSRKQPHVVVDESFVSDSFVDESLRFDGMGPGAVDDDSDDDEIDVTGLAIDAPLPRHKSASGQGLWQPWELAKAG